MYLVSGWSCVNVVEPKFLFIKCVLVILMIKSSNNHYGDTYVCIYRKLVYADSGFWWHRSLIC